MNSTLCPRLAVGPEAIMLGVCGCQLTKHYTDIIQALHLLSMHCGFTCICERHGAHIAMAQRHFCHFDEIARIYGPLSFGQIARQVDKARLGWGWFAEVG